MLLYQNFFIRKNIFENRDSIEKRILDTEVYYLVIKIYIIYFDLSDFFRHLDSILLYLYKLHIHHLYSKLVKFEGFKEYLNQYKKLRTESQFCIFIQERPYKLFKHNSMIVQQKDLQNNFKMVSALINAKKQNYYLQVISSSKKMTLSIQKSVDSTLQSMFNQVKPKARYISQLHVDEYNDSIYKEIINGDIQIPKEKQQFQKKQQKNDYQQVIRKKFMSQAQREKQKLQNKLGYLSNSINAMKKYDQLRASIKSPQAMRQSYTMGTSRMRDEQWRKQIKIRQKQLQQRKKKVEEERAKKLEQMKQFEQKLKQQRNEKKKKQILQKMKIIQQRVKNRDQQMKTGNQRYGKLKKEKKMFQKISQSYQQKQLSFLQEQKKKLAEIRSLKKPINENQLREHDEKFMQLKRQKQQLRDRQRKMNQSRTKTYRPMYESVFYKKVVEDEKNQQQNPSIVKTQKIKQFSSHVKQHFAPSISDKKKEQLQNLIEKQRRKSLQKQQRDRQLLQKPKQKGLEYLQIIRNIPKKKKDSSLIQPPKTDRIKYHNYITHHSDNTQTKQPWTKILNSSRDKQTKAIQIQFQSQKKEQQLKRKQQQARLMKHGDSGKIDDQYFDMIKAKLDLLKNDD